MLVSALRVLVIVLAVYLLVVTLAWKYQDRLAFPAPRYATLPHPAAARMPDGVLVSVITSDSVELKGWYLPPNPAPPAGTPAPALIWFYGNMETVAGMAPVLREFRPPGTAMLVLDYRGYGASGGAATEDGVCLDAEAAWAFLAAQREVDSTRIAVYGRSVGSVPALYLATNRPVSAVILDSPFTSAREMRRVHYAWLPPFITRLSLDNLARARDLRVPLLVIHGTADRIAPIAMGRAVAEAGRGELVTIEGGGHNDTYDLGGDVYRERMHRFLAESMSRSY